MISAPTDAITDRLAGTLLGTALGDALGLPAEGMSAAITKRFGRVHGFRLLGRPGSSPTTQNRRRWWPRPSPGTRMTRSSAYGPLTVAAGLVLPVALRRRPGHVGLYPIALGISPQRAMSAGNWAAMRSVIVGASSRPAGAGHAFGGHWPR